MSDYKIPVVAGLATAVFAELVFVGGEDAIAESEADKIDYTSMSPEALAEHLVERPRVKRVLWPGLPQHPGHRLAARQARGFGGVVSFLLDGDELIEMIDGAWVSPPRA